jgi:flagellin
MPAVLNTNAASLYASKNLQSAQSKMAQSVERLSSGLRINRAKDDAAGLGISNSLTSQINGANQGIRNLNDGISMVQTAEGAIAAAQEMAQRILTLATQGANGTMGTTDRIAIKSEMKQLLAAIEAIGNRTKFSGNGLLNTDARATATTKFSLQTSQQTNDTIALASNAFANIGGVSATPIGATTILSPGTGGNQATGVSLILANVTGLVVGMTATGGAIPAGATIATITAGTNTITLSAATTAVTAQSTSITFGNGVVNTVDTVMSLASGSNPPQTLVGSTVYKITSGTYASLGIVKSISGNDVTITGTATTTFASTDVIAFSGQLTQKHSTTTGDVSLSESVASTTNDTADFQKVVRAADAYVAALTTQRSLLGAYQNQIEYTVSNVTELSANLDAARSNVQDTDYASETATLTKGQILQQAATAMLAQANQMPNVILSLLK